MTDPDTSLTDTIDALEKECHRLRRENSELKQTLSHMRLNKQAFDGNNKRVKFYTGLLSYTTLMAIFSFVSAHIPVTQFSNQFSAIPDGVDEGTPQPL